MELRLDEPIDIPGRGRIILTSDEIVAESPFEDALIIEPLTAKHGHIWVRESTIVDLRNRHPGIPIYGFWQVMLLSNLVELDAPLHIYRLGSNDGLYLIAQNGEAISAGPFINTIPDPAYSIEEALELGYPDLSRLVLPRSMIRLPVELQREANRRQQVVGLFVAAGVAVAVVGGFAADFGLRKLSEHRVAEAAQISAEAATVEAKAAAIERNANPFTPELVLHERALFSRLGEAAVKLSAPTTPQITFTDHPDITLVSEKDPLPMSFETVVRTHPGLPVTVTFNQDGSAKPEPPKETPR